ncbi:periplasmic binding domain protein [Paraburkholderia xenovorans LB400]|uniref:Amino acid/amide ABC transporter substrate-binding protein, HAAT family n=1 Tax=Paraburkholderia xenovorans (strain LB400) TaxID=266265 RepID=Q13IE6_PARXL|nr:ABC transporter substrate-binding protein [Paraburkholderia xenovorans]ABE36143.1 amino acid/amide ABC transporter substrate-binding protein, HAAT family [Paraburkholderia xenovorans LB400]AIP34954.1 periplasmic binding domain protein [Paraburkholderia xenovorans LB400]
MTFALCVTAAGTLACQAARAAEPVRIGLIQPLTGSVAYNGHADVNGAKLAVAEINKAGGVLGRPVELKIEDGQCNPANTVNAAEKLIQKDRVSALIGAFCSSSTAAIMPVAQKYHLPLVTGVSSEADLTEKGNPWFFRAAETDQLLAHAFAPTIIRTLQLKSVAYVGVNDDWGRGSVQEFQQSLQAGGVKTVSTDYFDHGATDFYTLLTKLRASGADAVFVAAETQDGSILVKQIKELGLHIKVFGVGSWATADFIDLAGPAAEGVYAAVPYASTLTTPENTAFVASYQTAYKAAPGKYSAAGYNAVEIVAKAIARAGSTDADKIRAALAQTDFAAPNGRYRFTAKGQAYGFSVVLVQIHNKAPQVVATTPVSAPH